MRQRCSHIVMFQFQSDPSIIYMFYISDLWSTRAITMIMVYAWLVDSNPVNSSYGHIPVAKIEARTLDCLILFEATDRELLNIRITRNGGSVMGCRPKDTCESSIVWLLTLLISTIFIFYRCSSRCIIPHTHRILLNCCQYVTTSFCMHMSHRRHDVVMSPLMENTHTVRFHVTVRFHMSVWSFWMISSRKLP